MATKRTPAVLLEHQGQRRIEGYCKECEWKSDNWLTGAGQATEHCKATGHSVEVTKEYVYTVHLDN